MLPTFVIGLREGLEAALIVGIVAAFLQRNGRADKLRLVWVGVGAAVAICLAGGIARNEFEQTLPQKQQEGLETVIAVIAVAMVTYMIIWMKRNSRGLKGQLEGAASTALASGSAGALVAMAFLAVLREGFETAVFLLAAFNATGTATLAVIGAVLGIAISVAIGYLIYRGGVRLNLSRFFTVTSVLLVLVAGGLVASAIHTAHEAGWINIGQAELLDLSVIVQPGTPIASLVTGVLGVQPRPTVIEVIGWLAYVVPMLCYVLLVGRASKKPSAAATTADPAPAGRPGAAAMNAPAPAGGSADEPGSARVD
jgi:high-affinity iron transporter